METRHVLQRARTEPELTYSAMGGLAAGVIGLMVFAFALSRIWKEIRMKGANNAPHG